MYFYISKILAPLLKLTNFLVFLIIILFVFKKKYSNKNLIFIKNFSIILFLIISLTPVGNFGLRYLEKDFFNQQPFSEIDNIIILAGAEDVNLTKLRKKLVLNNSSERLISSVKLSRENPNSNIYFLGGDGYLVKDEIDETHVSKLFYNYVGLDAKKVNFINNSRNTIENLKEFNKIKNDDNDKNILITSAFHMKRVMIISKKLGINIIPYPVDFRSSNDFFINYYQGFSISKNLQSFDIFFRELLGILAFKLFF